MFAEIRRLSQRSILNSFWKAVNDPRLQLNRNTTVLCVRKGNDVVMAADGQVTVGSSVVKPNVHKLRRVNDRVVGGFAGSTADAFTLFDNLEIKLEEHPDQIMRAAVELAKLWRTDKFLRKLDVGVWQIESAVLIVADADKSLEITGQGDVLEPHDGILAIGSGSPYALAAARALINQPDMDARQIADADIYTNHTFTWEVLDIKKIREEEDKKEAELANEGKRQPAAREKT